MNDITPNSRFLILVFTAGGLGEHAQTMIADWDDQFSDPEKIGLIGDAILAAWQTLPEQWRFALAIDSSNGSVLCTPATLGWITTTYGQHEQTLPLNATPSHSEDD